MILEVAFNFIKALETKRFIQTMRHTAKAHKVSLVHRAKKASYLYFKRSLSTTDRTTGFLSTESSKGESIFVRICCSPDKRKKMKIKTGKQNLRIDIILQHRLLKGLQPFLKMGVLVTSTMRRDNRWRIIVELGGELSLKHILDTRSMKKALHRFLN